MSAIEDEARAAALSEVRAAVEDYDAFVFGDFTQHHMLAILDRLDRCDPPWPAPRRVALADIPLDPES